MISRRFFLIGSILGAFFISGCTTNYESLAVGQTKTAYIGDPLFVSGDLYAPTKQLLLSGITSSSIVLEYKETMPDYGSGRSYARPAFDRRLEYGRKSKVIRFKKVALQVIKVSDDNIVYKRIK